MSELLNVKQKLDANLGSNQLIEVLDILLEKCFDVLMEDHEPCIVEWLCFMAHRVSISGEKKNYSTDVKNSLLVSEILNAASVTTAKSVMMCRFDRIYPLTFLGNKISEMADKPKWSDRRALNALQYYYNSALRFISYISEKYYRMSYMQAEAMMRTTALSISRNDLWSNNNLMIITAILKYSANKGTLTEFIKTWMKANSNPRFPHENNIAYSIPPNKRRVMQHSEWEDNGIAVVNLAHNIDDAANVVTDQTGNVDIDDSKDRKFTLYAAASILLPDPDVIFYMQANAIPYYPQPVLGSRGSESMGARINAALDYSYIKKVTVKHMPAKRK